MYAEHNFYINDYKGSAIPDAPTYDRAAVEASAYLDYITHNRIDIDNMPEAVVVKVKLAQCAVADVCYKQAQDDVANVVSSETVGNHSVSYVVSRAGFRQRELEKHSKARMYLRGTGLLYGGLR
jgi:hypothetical protein